ncbi:Aste57867_17057 [Aphanomyces stellatus]|uniref:Aste57867_17057 protein n=1 Tax=Aphanomyces stellatus TaxID=120398 RepID=A0A485L781_9STRA|nr:hypothetical protein As57867_016999 [Aphanomyces stellatus]VFT93818.1 Aste57867_17057 [Aphanomyces stellatus]
MPGEPLQSKPPTSYPSSPSRAQGAPSPGIQHSSGQRSLEPPTRAAAASPGYGARPAAVQVPQPAATVAAPRPVAASPTRSTAPTTPYGAPSPSKGSSSTQPTSSKPTIKPAPKNGPVAASPGQESTGAFAAPVRRKSSLKAITMLKKPKVPTSLQGKRGSELWHEREKAFERFRKDNIVMPVPEGVHAPARVSKVSGYCIDLHAVKNWPEQLEGSILMYGVQLTFFHSLTRRFFGNTWLSPEIPDSAGRKPGGADVSIQISVAFLSDVVDANCVAVVELVAYEKDPVSLLTLASHGCGWALLPMFGQKMLATTKETLAVTVFQGTPRNLWVVPQSDWQHQEKVPGCKLLYHVRAYEPLTKVHTFLRKNEIVSSLDRIPGLKADNLVGIPKVNAVFQLPREIATAEEFALTVTTLRAFVHLREELEANLIERLHKTRKAVYRDVESLTGEVATRVLKVALHNGRCFRTRQHTVPLKCEHGSNTLAAVGDVVKLKGYSLSPLFAVVVVLQYTVHFRLIWPKHIKAKSEKEPLPTEDVVVVTLGARALVPSDGKKFYYHDRSSVGRDHVADEDDHLHVELLSGTKARPYSDNVIYTPPVWNNSVKAGKMEDTFASCDVELLVEGASLSSFDEDEAPATTTTTATEPLEHDRDKWIRELYQKAQLDAALARTLQAPLNSPPRKLAPPPRALEFTDALTTVVSDDPTPTHELSRASKSLLTRHGFYDAVTTSVAEPRPSTKPPVAATKSIGAELQDGMNLLDIQIQFAALRTMAVPSSSPPASVFFTFQFYTFEPTRTERLVVTPTQAPGTFLLCRDHAKKPSLALHFEVHTTKHCPLEAAAFASYLLTKPLVVDVWDGDSLLHLGSLSIPLHVLMRQGLRVKKHHAEYEVVRRSDLDHASTTTMTLGAVQILLANFAAQSTPCPATVVRPHQDPASGNWRFAKPDNQRDNDDERTIAKGPKHRVRARPLADTNEELRQLLIQHHFNDPSSTSSTSTRRPRHMQRGHSDATSITKDEIDRLCARFQSHATRNNRLDAQALLALLSMRAPPAATKSALELTDDLRDAFLAAFARGVDFRTMFETLDGDGDGVVTTTEFLDGLRRLGPEFAAVAPASVRACIAAFDANGDSRINYVEFLAFLHKKLHLSLRQELQAIFTRAVANGTDVAALFRQLDTSRDGQLSFREFEMALKHVGFRVSDRRQFDAFCHSLDDDGNGTISYMEFIRHMGLETQAQDAVLSTLQAILKRTVAKGIDIVELFHHMDADGSGSVSYAEFMHVLSDLDLDKSLTSAMLQEIVLRVDKDKSGSIDVGEFLAFANVPHDAAKLIQRRLARILARAADQGVSVRDAFTQFDQDGSGLVSAMEFEATLKALACPLAPLEVALVLSKCDADHDGQVSYEEFLAFVFGSDTRAVLAKPATTQLTTLFHEAAAKGIDLGQCFAHFDKDGSREITADEFVQALLELGFEDTSADAIRAVVETLDADHDGKINFDEFMALATPRTRARQDVPPVKLFKMLHKAMDDGVDVESAFAHFDKAGTGAVSHADFTSALRELGSTPWSKADMDAIFKQLDKDGSGSVSLKEFQTFLQITPATRFRALLVKAQAEGVALEHSFGHFSPTHDGLDVAALQAGLVRLQFQDVTPADVQTLFRTINASKSGWISIQELAAFVGTTKGSTKPTKTPIEKLKALLLRAQEQGVDIHASFAHFDKDGNGTISYDEFDAAMQQLKFDDLSAADVVSIRNTLDKDHSGAISLDEFTQLYGGPLKKTPSSSGIQKPPAHLEKLKELLAKAQAQGIDVGEAFAQFDTDGNGAVSYAEFDATMAKLGFEDLTRDELGEIHAALDKAQHGSISLEDFKSLYAKPATTASKPPPLAKTPSLGGKKGSKQADEGATESATTATDEATPIARLRDLLVRAKAQGIDVDQAFAHFDADGNGAITHDEFNQALRLLQFDDVTEADMAAMCAALDKDKGGSISLDEFKAIYADGPKAKPPSRPPLTKKPSKESAEGASDGEKKGESSSSDADKKNKPPPGSKPWLAKKASSKKAQVPTPLETLGALLRRAQDAGIDIGQAFAHFDADGNGTITHVEFNAAIQTLQLEGLTDSDMESMRDALDKDKSGTISMDEFRKLYAATTTPASVKVDKDKTEGAMPNGQAAPPMEKKSSKSKIHATVEDEAMTEDKPKKKPSKGYVLEEGQAKTTAGDETAKPTPLGKLRQCLLKLQATGANVDQVFANADATSSGGMSYTDFDAVLFELNVDVLSDADIVAVREALDMDMQGVIPLAALQQVYAEAGPAKGAAAKEDFEPTSKQETPVDKLRRLLGDAKSNGADVARAFGSFASAEGSISYTDFDAGLLELGLDELTEAEIVAVREALDGDKSGVLLLAKLAELWTDMKPNSRADGTAPTLEKKRASVVATGNDDSTEGDAKKQPSMSKQPTASGSSKEEASENEPKKVGVEDETKKGPPLKKQATAMSSQGDESESDTKKGVQDSESSDEKKEDTNTRPIAKGDDSKSDTTAAKGADASKEEQTPARTKAKGEKTTNEEAKPAKTKAGPPLKQPAKRPSTLGKKPGKGESDNEIKDLFAESDQESKSHAVNEDAPDDGPTAKLRELLLRAKASGVNIDQAFAHFDKDGNGMISHDEFNTGIAELKLDDLSAGEIEAIRTGLDKDKSGSISLVEFKKLYALPKAKAIKDAKPKPWLAKKGAKSVAQGSGNATVVTKEVDQPPALLKLRELLLRAKESGVDIAAAFAHFDVDGDGIITSDEFHDGLKALNVELAADEVTQIQTALDRDKSGAVSLVEFKKLYETTAAAPSTAARKPVARPTAKEKACESESNAKAGKHPSQVARSKSATTTPMEQLGAILTLAREKGVDVDAAFAHFDTNGDGTITHAEFGHALKELGVDKLSTAQVDDIVHAMDKDKSGTISLHEFKRLYDGAPPAALPQKAKGAMSGSESESTTQSAVTRRRVSTKQPDVAALLETLTELLRRAQAKGVDVHQSFAHFDKDGNGAVSFAEFEAALQGLQLNQFKGDDVRALCQALDKDGGGSISLAEFRKLYDVVPPLRRLPSSTSAGGKASASTRNATTPRSAKADDPSAADSSWTASSAVKSPNACGNPRVATTSRAKDECDDAPSSEYRFSTEPETRVLELKVRKAAIAALARGVPAGPLLAKYTQKPTGEVLRVDFVQFLMELGLSVIDDLGSGGYVCDAPLMHDKVYARQLERLRQYRQRNNRSTSKAQRELVQAASMTNTARAPRHGTAHVDAFVAQKNKMLQVVQYYRDGHKKSLIHALLRDHVTTTMHVYPRFGSMLFFELRVRNPYGHAERFRIEWHDPELLLVTDSTEWQYYRDHVPSCVDDGDREPTDVERDMIDEMHELLLEGGDAVSLPFRLVTLHVHKQKRTVPVYVKSVAHGHVISVFQVHVEPLSFVVHRTFRFYHASGGILRRCLKLLGDVQDDEDDRSNQDGKVDKFVACPDASVVVETKPIEHKHMPQEIFIKYRVGEYPSSGEFYLVLYEDMYHARLYEIWRVIVQSMLRLDLHASMGQGVQNELIIKGDTMPRRVRCYSSQPQEVHFNPDRIFQLQPHAFNRIEVHFCSMHVCTSQILVNLVDVDSHDLVGSWLLNTTTTEPVVTKVFDVSLPLGVPVLKKISYRNPWEDDRLFILRTNDQSVMKPREPKLHLRGNADGFLRLAFAPHSVPCTKKAYLFINDGTDQNEECLLLHLTWSDEYHRHGDQHH